MSYLFVPHRGDTSDWLSPNPPRIADTLGGIKYYRACKSYQYLVTLVKSQLWERIRRYH